MLVPSSAFLHYLRNKLFILPYVSFRPDAFTQKDKKMLGTKPDLEIARLLGRTEIAVRMRRHTLHIPDRFAGHRHYLPEEDKLLGTRPDEEVAEILGRPLSGVLTRRQTLGIPKVNRT